jgi:hypothetical protein
VYTKDYLIFNKINKMSQLHKNKNTFRSGLYDEDMNSKSKLSKRKDKDKDEDWEREQVSTYRHGYLDERDLLELGDGDGDGDASAGSA